MKTAPIIGHQRVFKFLKRALANDQVSHAYLFFGPAQLGKGTIANWFARELVGANASAERNIIVVRPETSLKIAAVRSLQHELSLTNPFGDSRVVILGDIDDMTIEAQNAFLKLLEEPQTKVIFILLAKKLGSILPTIISRTQLVRFASVSIQELETALIDQGVASAQARQVARLAGGRPGWALSHIVDKQKLVNLQEQIQEFIRLFQAGIAERFQIVRRVSDAEDQGSILEIWESILRDIFILQQHRDSDITHVNLRKDLRAISDKFSAVKIMATLRGLRQAQQHLRKNLNHKLVLENFVLSHLPS
ncbi:ATP-binding protein [Patescibacteria group bacterium]